MTRFGYTLMCEQTGPRELVRDAARAERAGFDFEVISDHYFPWLDSQGHAPNAWAVLGAVAQATERIDLMTYVTCPIIRYHPAVVAQHPQHCAHLAQALRRGGSEDLEPVLDSNVDLSELDDGGLGLHAAADVHQGHAAAVQDARADVLAAACLAHPERFARKPPALPGASWINPRQEKDADIQ